MKGDYLSYRRAVSVSLLGLMIQAVVGVAMLIAAVLGHDKAALSTSFYTLVGVLGWLTLAIMFDQHRRERIEAMQAESLASADAASSSVFEEGAADLRMAANRLRTMQRLFVPAMSILIALLMIGLGIWRFIEGQGKAGSAISTLDRGWSVSIAVGAAFMCFVYARYVAGMARNRVWSTLQGGASLAAGTTVLCALLAIGHFIDLFSTDTLLRQMQIIIPVLMIVFGVEILMSFVLEVYRPRRADDVERYAFESRALGLVAAPDRVARSVGEAISYQLGTDITSSWQHKLLERVAVPFILLGGLVLWLLTMFAVVQPHQRGMLLRFGRVVNPDIGPGLHIKMPWPIDSIVIPDHIIQDRDDLMVEHVIKSTTGIRDLKLGAHKPSSTVNAALWSNSDVGVTPFYFVVQPAATISAFGIVDPEEEATRSRPDGTFSLLSIEVPLRFAVRDAEAFEMLGEGGQRELILFYTARRVILEELGSARVDQLLGDGRQEIADRILRGVRQKYIELNPIESQRAQGIPVVDVIYVGIQGVRPPKESSLAFEQVQEAEQKYLALIENARGKARSTLIEAAGDETLARAIVAEIEVRKQLANSGASAEEIIEQDQKIQRLVETAGGNNAQALLKAASDRWVTHMAARARAENYLGQVDSYLASPLYYTASLYLDALGDALSKARIYIVDDSKANVNITQDMSETEATADIFDSLSKSSQAN
ncbi:MAG: hypothetical protein H6815_07805 [Phycisphaeraceae bacterium]|nr:hypothetical protein [Phycisphaerales bacterium]MCB9860345.1 hypothetical protein [Phycisphaeraceae bacterium]